MSIKNDRKVESFLFTYPTKLIFNKHSFKISLSCIIETLYLFKSITFSNSFLQIISFVPDKRQIISFLLLLLFIKLLF